jgi:ribulose 1,5-bisphosphate carboxylase large subunit-like protein
MNDFFIFAFFAIGSAFVVVVQAITIALLAKWNAELKKQVEYFKPPF